MFDYLQPGVVVKDRAGIHKRVIRVDSGKVCWIYADLSSKRRHNADYDRFIDTHFLVGELRMQKAQAA